MTKRRVIIFFTTILTVSILGYLLSLYARGYRFDPTQKQFEPSGLLVMKSNPDGAQVYVNENLKGATNTTLNLQPGTYDINVRKEGYQSWTKRIIIKKEEVTEADAHLFKTAPSLSALTFTGVINPVASYDQTKIIYAVEAKADNIKQNLNGLWIIETVDLPLGFAKAPFRITDGDLKNFTWEFSPDGREILLMSQSLLYLLDSSKFTSQNQRVNVIAQETKIRSTWENIKKEKLNSQIKSLPDNLNNVLKSSHAVLFSPDETHILYIASESAKLSDQLKTPLPGSSTQKQEREIKPYHTYIYDIKEDRNYLIDEDSKDLHVGNYKPENFKRSLYWFPTSRHVVLADKDKITIIDKDGTNRKEVFTGNYISPNAFPTVSLDRLIILTNLGSNTNLSNLYILSLK